MTAYKPFYTVKELRPKPNQWIIVEVVDGIFKEQENIRIGSDVGCGAWELGSYPPLFDHHIKRWRNARQDEIEDYEKRKSGSITHKKGKYVFGRNPAIIEEF